MSKNLKKNTAKENKSTDNLLLQKKILVDFSGLDFRELERKVLKSTTLTKAESEKAIEVGLVKKRRQEIGKSLSIRFIDLVKDQRESVIKHYQFELDKLASKFPYIARKASDMDVEDPDSNDSKKKSNGDKEKNEVHNILDLLDGGN